ncbi:lipoprotein insertase outer membrane protein LolB [Paralcaligenes ginsengisoli]|jgi:outer membrane lipoprotein LolB
MRLYRAWLVFCLAGLLAACATPHRITDAGGARAFERTGRFAVSVMRDNGKQQAVQGGFAWRDDGQTLRLDLANPLGNTLARVQVSPGYSVLTRSDGSQEQASDPDGLVEQVLGSAIPVEGLRDWLRGRTGAVLNLEKNQAGQATSFQQNGWRVVLSRYDSLGPRLLQLNRNDSNQRISVRLVVDGT